MKLKMYQNVVHREVAVAKKKVSLMQIEGCEGPKVIRELMKSSSLVNSLPRQEKTHRMKSNCIKMVQVV